MPAFKPRLLTASSPLTSASTSPLRGWDSLRCAAAARVACVSTLRDFYVFEVFGVKVKGAT